MNLKYTCPGYGTPLCYDELCWKCKSEQERKAVLSWSPEQIKEKQNTLIRNIQRLADMENPELTGFWKMLSYRDAITPEIQRAALAAEVFYPCEIYYQAPKDVRDGLISALLSTEYSGEASNLMCCLAMQGDDRALETLLELEKNPRPWRKSLYVDPSIYAQCGGWTFERSGPDGMIALIFWGDYRYASYDTSFVFERYVDLDERWLFDLAKDPQGRKSTVTWQAYNRGGVLHESYDEMFISLLPRKVENPELKRVL